MIAQPRLDIRDDMHDVTVTFDDHVFRQAHSPDLCDSAKIVASEVDQHHMFGTLLRVSQ